MSSSIPNTGADHSNLPAFYRQAVPYPIITKLSSSSSSSAPTLEDTSAYPSWEPLHSSSTALPVSSPSSASLIPSFSLSCVTLRGHPLEETSHQGGIRCLARFSLNSKKGSSNVLDSTLNLTPSSDAGPNGGKDANGNGNGNGLHGEESSKSSSLDFLVSSGDIDNVLRLWNAVGLQLEKPCFCRFDTYLATSEEIAVARAARRSGAEVEGMLPTSVGFFTSRSSHADALSMQSKMTHSLNTSSSTVSSSHGGGAGGSRSTSQFSSGTKKVSSASGSILTCMVVCEDLPIWIEPTAEMLAEEARKAAAAAAAAEAEGDGKKGSKKNKEKKEAGTADDSNGGGDPSSRRVLSSCTFLVCGTTSPTDNILFFNLDAFSEFRRNRSTELRFASALTSQSGPVTALNFFRRMLFVGAGESVLVYKWIEESSVFELVASHDNFKWSVWDIACVPNSSLVFVAAGDNTIRGFESVGTKEPRALEGHTDWIRCLACSSDGKYLFSGSMDASICMWLVQPDKNESYGLKSSFSGHEAMVTCLVVDDEWGILYSGSFDCSIRAWNISSGSCIAVLRDHRSTVTRLLLTQNHLFSASLDGTVKAWPRLRAPVSSIS